MLYAKISIQVTLLANAGAFLSDMISVKSLSNYINATHSSPISIELKEDEQADTCECTITENVDSLADVSTYSGKTLFVINKVVEWARNKYPDLDIDRFQGAGIATPLELVNMFKNKRSAELTIDATGKPFGELKYTLENEKLLFRASYRYHKHHGYTKNKIAQLLLEEAAVHDKLARKYINRITKLLPMIEHIKLPEMESVNTEYKGAEKNCDHLTLKTAKNNSDKVMKTLCGMANNKGGIVYIGVHDSGSVQGIMLNNSQADDLKKYFENMIANDIKPSLSYDLVILPVSHYKDKPQLKLIPEDSELNTRDLIKDLNKLKQEWNTLWSTPKLFVDYQVARENCLVFQFNVRPASTLLQYKGVCCFRREGVNSSLTADQIVQEMLRKRI